MLILLPLTFLQFFWMPWMEAQALGRRPRKLDPGTRDHVILVQHDPLSLALIERLVRFQYSYVLIEPDPTEAARLADEGLNVVLGDLDDPRTYRGARVTDAALVVAARSDEMNTQIASTVRAISESIPIIGTADVPASVDILELAGCNHVLQLGDLLGESLARRTTAGDAMAHVIGEFGELLIAEATTTNTPIVGQTLVEADLRRKVGIHVIGIWERGQFQPARPETRITGQTVLVLAADQDQLYRYNSLFAIYNQSAEPVIIIGAGRVGRATARSLEERKVDYRIVERDPEAAGDDRTVVKGSAAELEVLQEGRHRHGAGGGADHAGRRNQHLPGHLLPPAAARHPDHRPGEPGSQRADPAPRRHRLRHVLPVHGGPRDHQPAAAQQHLDDRRGTGGDPPSGAQESRRHEHRGVRDPPAHRLLGRGRQPGRLDQCQPGSDRGPGAPAAR